MSIWNYNLDFMIFFYKRFRITRVYETEAQMIGIKTVFYAFINH